jgi:hypothetical protein
VLHPTDMEDRWSATSRIFSWDDEEGEIVSLMYVHQPVSNTPHTNNFFAAGPPLVFGTSPLLGPNTDLEVRTTRYMQNAWVAFARIL